GCKQDSVDGSLGGDGQLLEHWNRGYYGGCPDCASVHGEGEAPQVRRPLSRTPRLCSLQCRITFGCRWTRTITLEASFLSRNPRRDSEDRCNCKMERYNRPREGRQ